MKCFYTLLLLVLTISINSHAQSYQRTDLGIKSTINTVAIEIQFYGPSTVRVLKWPEGETFTKESLSVILTPQKTAVDIRQHGEELSMKSRNLQVW